MESGPRMSESQAGIFQSLTTSPWSAGSACEAGSRRGAAGGAFCRTGRALGCSGIGIGSQGRESRSGSEAGSSGGAERPAAWARRGAFGLGCLRQRRRRRGVCGRRGSGAGRGRGCSGGCRSRARMGLGGVRVRLLHHLGLLGAGGEGEDGVPELDLVAVAEAAGILDALCVHERPVGGAEVLDHGAHALWGDARVASRDAGVSERQVGVVPAADRHRAGERDLPSGVLPFTNDQHRLGHYGESISDSDRVPAKPGTRLELVTPSLPWRCSTN